MTKKQNEHHIERMKEISMLIKNWRVNDLISQYEFGCMAETHTNTIRNLEAGKNVTVLTLFNCIDALGVTVSEFFESIK
jgi:transcriptional regulator with XRE-family HTH domain